MKIVDPGIGKTLSGYNNCRASVVIDYDPEGGWFWKWTCPDHPDYLCLIYADKELARSFGKKDTIHATDGIRHWGNTFYTKHLEKN